MARPEPGPRSWFEDLFSMLARVIGALNRRNAEFLRRATALMGPYALRSLSRRKWRGAMLAASIALALISFIMFSAYLNATRTRMVGRVVPLELGGEIDAIAVASHETTDGFPENVVANPRLLARGTPEEGLLDTLYTSLGSSRVWGFRTGGLAASAVTLADGEFPDKPGEVAVPQSWADDLGATPGSNCELRFLNPETNEWQGVEGRVVGVMQEDSYITRYPVTTFETMASLRGTSKPNVVLIRWAGAVSPRTATRELESILDPVQILTPDTPRKRAAELVGGLFSPLRVVMMVVFAFSALGVLNVMLLSFLQRRRQFGILKASGAEDGELQVLLLLEGFLMALGGVVAGIAVAGLAVFVLNKYTTDIYLLNPLALVGGILLSVVVFYVGAWLPINMLRRATVDELLRNRRF